MENIPSIYDTNLHVLPVGYNLSSKEPIRHSKSKRIYPSMTEIFKLVDKLTIVNQIVNLNISSDLRLFTILPEDISNFKKVLIAIERSFTKDNIVSITNSKKKIDVFANFRFMPDSDELFIITEIDRAVFTKYFLLLVSLLTHSDHCKGTNSANFMESLFLTFKLIKKLYFDEIILEKEMSIIIKFTFILSLFNSNFIDDNIDKNGKGIKSIIFIWLTLSFLSSLTELTIQTEEKSIQINALLDDILTFFERKILANFNSIAILYESNKFISLLDILKIDKLSHQVKSKVISLVTKVYEGNYSAGILNDLMNKAREALVNWNRAEVEQIFKDIQMMNGQIEFFKCLCMRENSRLKHDKYTIRRGFVMNDHPKSGISLGPIISFPKKGYTLIFSFKWSPKVTTGRYNLIALITEREKPMSKNEELASCTMLNIYIEDRKLMIMSQIKWNTEIEIIPEVSYLVYLTQTEAGILTRGKSILSITLNNQEYTSPEKLRYPTGSIRCLMGFFYSYEPTKSKIINDYQFVGTIGTILLLSDNFSKEFICNLFNLKGMYERLLMMKNYDTSVVDKYDYYYNDTSYANSVEYFQKNDNSQADLKVSLMISSKSIIKLNKMKNTSILKTSFKENYMDFPNNKFTIVNRKFDLMTPPSPINGATYPFLYKLSTYEFLKLDGIKVLCLHMEYYAQIVERIHRSQSELGNDTVIRLMNAICTSTENILEHALNVLEIINLDYYIGNLTTFFVSMSNLIHQICRIQKLQGNTIVCLIRYLSLLNMKEELKHYNELRNKFCYFLLSIELYDLRDFLGMESLMAVLDTCLRNNPQGLISLTFLKNILDFTCLFDLKLTEELDRTSRTFSFPPVKILNKNNNCNVVMLSESVDNFQLVTQNSGLTMYYDEEKIATKKKTELKEMKRSLSNLIQDFLQICIKENFELVRQYINYIKDEKEKVYKEYKLLKILYCSITDRKSFVDTLCFDKSHSDFLDYFTNLIQFLEAAYKDQMIIQPVYCQWNNTTDNDADNFIDLGSEHISEKTNNMNNNNNTNLPTIPASLAKELTVVELLKALSIRFIDEYSIILEETNVSQSQKPKPICYSSAKKPKYSSTQQLSSPTQTKLNSPKGSVLSSELKSNSNQDQVQHEQNPIDRLINNFTPTPYTLRSFYISLFKSLSPEEKIIFIKNKQGKSIELNVKEYSRHSRHSVYHMVQLIERISYKAFSTVFSNSFILLSLGYDLMSDLVFKMLERYNHLKKRDDIKPILKHFFESPKICLNFFIHYFSSYWLSESEIQTQIVEGSKVIVTTGNESYFHSPLSTNNVINEKVHIKQRIRKDLISIIKSSITTHTDPFYFQLVYELFCQEIEENLILEMLEAMILKITENSGKEDVFKQVSSNNKNLILLLYRMLFVKMNNKNLFKYKQFEAFFIPYMMSLHSNQIIFTKMNFDVANFEVKEKLQTQAISSKKGEGKTKTLLEMVFEIYLHLYLMSGDFKYINLIEELLLMRPKNKHTIMLYMDKMYLSSSKEHSRIKSSRFKIHQIELLEKKIFFTGMPNLYLMTYYFLVKICVYLKKIGLSSQNEEKIQQDFLKSLRHIAEITSYDALSIYQKHKKVNHHQLKNEIKDPLYLEMKKLIENMYNLDQDFEKLMTVFDDVMTGHHREMRKYVRLSYDIHGNPCPSKSSLMTNSNGSDEWGDDSHKNVSGHLFGNSGRIKSLSKLPKSGSYEVLTRPYPTEMQGYINAYHDEFKKESAFSPIIENSPMSVCESLASSEISQKDAYHLGLKSHNTPGIVISTHQIRLSKAKSGFNISESAYLTEQFNDPQSGSASTIGNSNMLIMNRLAQKKMDLDIVEPKSSDTANMITNSNYIDNVSDISSEGILIHPKRDLLLTSFGVYFKENIFFHQLFEEMQKFYQYKFNYNDTKDSIKYPTKLKNFFTSSYYRPFVKPDTRFFSNPLFKYSHEYFKNLIDYNAIKTIHFNQRILIVNHPIKKFECEMIIVEGAIFGELILAKDYLMFKDRGNDPRFEDNFKKKIDYIFSSLDSDIIKKPKQVIISYSEISEVLVRRFLFMWQANEIFLKNGRSYMFNMFNKACNNEFFDLMRKMNKAEKGNERYPISFIQDCQKHFKNCEYTKKWADGEFGNLEYLLMINKFAGRSFHDVNQYPVFPWVLTDYENPPDDIQLVLRNFSYPVSVQSEEKRMICQKKYVEDHENKFKLHFRSHYSTSAFVSYYLMRIPPVTYNLIRLQANKFEHPNRMFHCLQETWDILDKYNDNRELTPEFFLNSEFLMNLNCNDFGMRSSDGIRVHNVQLPSWGNSPMGFIYRHREILESKQVGYNLNQWIDNIFGVTQLWKEKESCNVFSKYSYEQHVNLEIKKEKFLKSDLTDKQIYMKLKNKVCMILNFGETPYQLFDERHPQRLVKCKKTKNDDLTPIVEMSPQKNKIKVDQIKKGVIYFSISANQSWLYILNGDRELELCEYKSLKRKNKIRLKHFLFLSKFKVKESLKYKKEDYENLPSMYIYKPKYIFFELLDCKYFIFGRHLDSSLKIYNTENHVKDFLCDSFITSCVRFTDTHFFTGYENGKLIQWELRIVDKSNDLSASITPVQHLIAHEGGVTAILIKENLNAIFTGGEDGYVYIRNLYSLEMITAIRPMLKDRERSAWIIDIKISAFDLLYILAYDPKQETYVIFGYNLNGICFSVCEGLFNNFEFTSSGKIVCGFLNKKKIVVLDPIDLNTQLYEIVIGDNEVLFCMFSHFTFHPDKKLFHCGFTDGTLIRYVLTSEKEIEAFS